MSGLKRHTISRFKLVSYPDAPPEDLPHFFKGMWNAEHVGFQMYLLSGITGEELRQQQEAYQPYAAKLLAKEDASTEEAIWLSTVMWWVPEWNAALSTHNGEPEDIPPPAEGGVESFNKLPYDLRLWVSLEIQYAHLPKERRRWHQTPGPTDSTTPEKEAVSTGSLLSD
jgi:hypothetical protein